jgi:acetyltransferase-like isoleucine patch superfamily enzyme
MIDRVNNQIYYDFNYGHNLKLGYFNVIEPKVKVGKRVIIENHTLLKSNTIIGDDCYIDSYVLTSGDCIIGNNVFLRYQTIIARNVIIQDDCFFCAGVKTIFLNHLAQKTIKPLIIKSGSFFGDNCIIMGGVTVAENCVIGAGAFVNKDTKPMGVYVGLPAIRIRDLGENELWWKNK